tara:strand:- start:28 stop:453 length:426 start_codon:yes stop_codon:yes gene_type:complete
MATRSRIGLRLADDAILSVYHHWDGYPQWLGVTLVEKYTTKEQVAELLDGGDISCIESETDWNNKECEPHVQYYNDRGEKTEPRLDLNEYDFFMNNEEFAYIFDDGKWSCYDLTHKYDDEFNVTSYTAELVTIPSPAVARS